MTKNIQAIRGMHDIVPAQTVLWQFLESGVAEVLTAYGYQEIRMPIVEKTELFKRSIGEVTDIVEKEMYTFEDRNGDSLTLRPEGTASCVRAGIENGLLYNQQQRFWYAGPMFRHERPQKGRYRQFHQIGVETFGMPGPDIDAEIIMMTARLWRVLGLHDVRLEINTLGTSDERAAYRDVLLEYLTAHQDQLDEDSQRRLHANPLRILDTKNPDMQTLVNAAPQLIDHLGESSMAHFERLRSMLDSLGIIYLVNPRLVRGLDYYCHTVFEWVTDSLGAQGTVCAGGRYDGLVEQLGGKATPACGFAMGIERLVTMLEEQSAYLPGDAPDVYIVNVGDSAELMAVQLSELLHDQFSGLRVLRHCGGGSFKSQMKRADKSGARLAILIGEDEVKQDRVAIKFLREDKQQLLIGYDEVAGVLANEFSNT